MRYFYTDALASAWMAKHFGMRLLNCSGYELEYHHPYGFTADDLMTNVGDVLNRFYIHPDSLHLLEPQLGDIITINDLAIDYHGYCFRPDILYRTYANGSYGTDEFDCTKLADVRVIQRHCGHLIAFHWPEQETA